ncbi:hypothetical protein ABVK25_001954 [Lepraria finkii]|uniref:Fungal N-terminal domain-containing protein n=1 Tax=Lepraria finkii TaxID=1340010 RepID=A0ABR4BIS7_9LECA
METIAAASSILSLISGITKLAKSLNEVRDSYNNVALNTTLVASSLSTIRAALEALHEWRSNDQETVDHSKQLDKDLEVSLSCCAILITVIDGKLGESGYKPGMKQKIRYVWLEDILKEYLSNLEGQVRALQLLLTIYQCKTATEQRQKLERAESRRIIENVRAETQTLRTANRDFQDAASVLSLDPSVHFDFDSILMTTPAYINVYGERPLPQIPSPKTRNPPPVPQSPPKAIRSPPPVPDRALKPPRVPPRPPPRGQKRKKVWNPYLGQAVDVGTISKQDSGGLHGLPADQLDADTTDQPSFVSSQLPPDLDRDLETESEPEDFKTLSSKVVEASAAPHQILESRSVQTSSAPIGKNNEGTRPSTPESDIYGTSIRSTSPKSMAGNEEVNESTTGDTSLKRSCLNGGKSTERGATARAFFRRCYSAHGARFWELESFGSENSR